MKAKEVMSKDYIKIDMNNPVSKVLGQMRLKKEKNVLLFDGKTYKGIFSKHKMVRSKLDPAEWKAGKMLKRVPRLNGEEDLKEVARLMLTSNYSLLPVIEKGDIIGVVKASDIIDKLDTKTKRKKVIDIATTELVVVHENDRVGKAIQLMNEKTIERIPIVDDEGNLLNIVSITDLLSKYYLLMQSKTEARGRGGLTQNGPRTIRAFKTMRHNRIEGLPVKNFATPVIITATERENLRDVINDMMKFEIGSIVVTRDKKAVGIVTIRDLLKLFLPSMLTF